MSSHERSPKGDGMSLHPGCGCIWNGQGFYFCIMLGRTLAWIIDAKTSKTYMVPNKHLQTVLSRKQVEAQRAKIK